MMTPGMPPIGLGSLPFLSGGKTRSISAENPTGEPGKGGMAVPNPSEAKPAASARAADDLGQGWKVRPFLRVNAGETVTLMDVKGPGIIQHIWMVEGLSRGHVLRFYWDEEETPSIEVPAPDFFAVGHEQFARVNSLAVTVNPQNALNCYWPMPFRTRARVTFTNENKEDLQLLAYQITYTEVSLPKNAATFHAQWRRASTAEANPYVILDGVKGHGRYVGTFLAWTQLSPGWFGEGEIKFFMDGDDAFPTICGTGTEDYFLGSYGFPEDFSTAYSGTTIKNDENSGIPNFWSLYRWHITDPIEFQEDLRVTIQALGWGKDGKYKLIEDDIASVAYWYQTEPHAPFPPLPSLEERKFKHAPRPTPKVEGALEGENMTILATSHGEAKVQQLGQLGGDWSGNAQLWWTGAEPGAVLDLEIPVQHEGPYNITLQLTKAQDYGIVSLSLDGKALGEDIDLYHDVPQATGALDMGQFHLEEGKHVLQVRIVGANEQAEKAYMFGLDYLLLERG